MQLTVVTFPENNYYHDMAEIVREQNLVYYASEAIDEMEFESFEEMQDAIHRAMDLCIAGGYSVSKNFKRVFKCSTVGVVYDWKLSALAYNLVKLNGNPGNRKVADFQVKLLKNFYLHKDESRYADNDHVSA